MLLSWQHTHNQNSLFLEQVNKARFFKIAVFGLIKKNSLGKVSCFLGYFEDNIACHFTASMISGLATTYASMPVDIAKTRYLILPKQGI